MGLYTLFRIEPTRSSQVLIDTLGKEFNGVLGYDYFIAYRKYMRQFGVLVRFCLTHLIRDVKFLATLPDKKQQTYGKWVRRQARPESGQAVPQARRGLLPFHHHAGHRADEQSGGTGDPFCGYRPSDYAGPYRKTPTGFAELPD